MIRIAEAESPLVTSTVALSEALVAPARAGFASLQLARRSIRNDAGVEVVPVDEAVALDAAILRAGHGSLKTPDSLVVSTARILGGFAVTTDHRLARLDEAVTVEQFLAG